MDRSEIREDAARALEERRVMRSFISAGSFEIKDRGTAYTVYADREMSRDKPDILGERVLIDGTEATVTGVERHLPTHPIRQGEIISLLIAPPSAPAAVHSPSAADEG
jgi:hypothetical protein